MADAASATASLIPTVVAAGVALHVAERSFKATTGRSSKTHSKPTKRHRKRTSSKKKGKSRKRRKKSGPDRIMDEFRPRR